MRDLDGQDAYYRGLIHVHSRYSHDGRDSLTQIAARLGADGFEFCILTDHFEDLDRETFERYLADVEAVNACHKTVIVAAVEAELEGFHVILLPATSHDEILRFVQRGSSSDSGPLRILVHPTKHEVDEVVEFLHRQPLDGIELWNQRADGNYLPPAEFIRRFVALSGRSIPAVFFGADLHNVEHQASNMLLIRRSGELTPETVRRSLMEREFVNYNIHVGQSLAGDADPDTIGEWLDDLAATVGFKGKVRMTVRKQLRVLYHLLPRSAKVSINGFKNAVKSRL